MPLQLRRGTDSQRTNMSQPLAVGELIYVTDTGSIWVGDQAGTIGGLPIANYSLRDIQNFDAALLTSGTHTGITFTYVPNPSNPNLSKINAVVNVQLSNYVGTIKADAFKGTLVGDDSTILVDAVSGKINLNGTVDDDIIPKSFGPDLGSSAIPFNNVYVGGTVRIGSATISASSSRINLPAGSTVGGVTIGTGGAGGGVETGMNYNINIVGDDSTLIVNARTKAITAPGGVTGNLTGDVTGGLTLTKNILSTVYANTHDPASTSDSYVTVLGAKTLATNSTLYIHAGTQTAIMTRGYTTGYASTVDQQILVSRGTYQSPLAVQAGDSVGLLSFKGWDGAAYQAPAVILASVEAVSGGQQSGILSVVVKTLTDQQQFDFKANGNFKSPLLQTTVYSVAGTPLPNAATMGVGARAFVSDATVSTFASPYTGGGAQKVPVHSDGSVWRIG